MSGSDGIESFAVSEPSPQEAALRLVTTPDADIPPVYSNFVQVTFTPLDFTLHFGSYVIPALSEPPSGSEIQVPVRAIAKVSVPLSLVRGIVRVLERQINAWEESFGQPVPDQPEGVRPAVESQS